MKAILLDKAQKWLEKNCENQYTRIAVLGIIQSMPAVDYQEMPNEPLTLEQLMEMGSIPIWVVDTTINRREWCYWKDELAYSCEDHPQYYDPDEYGLWLAYRRPKEEES